MNETQAIAEIRGVLTALDSESADRQYALEQIDRIVNATPAVKFPGVNMGLLAYDISEAIDHGEYPGLDDISFSEIEPNLPAFLAACLATAAEAEDQS
jgi:hypothetical protein